MSKHNYSQYSKKSNKDKATPVETTVTKPTVEPARDDKPNMPELVEETVSTVTLPDTIEGTVINCAKLNVRENATVDSGIVCVLDVMSEIQVDVNRSSDKWVYVYTATGAEGYCMRQYIDVCL